MFSFYYSNICVNNTESYLNIGNSSKSKEKISSSEKREREKIKSESDSQDSAKEDCLQVILI